MILIYLRRFRIRQYLLTGATGLIGSMVARSLVAIMSLLSLHVIGHVHQYRKGTFYVWNILNSQVNHIC